MNLSFWELKNWFWNVDYTIVGSGIVGLHAALQLRSRFPESKILIIEKGMLPQGASTKNAGFACFGSISEIIDDLHSHSEEEVIQLIQKRWMGLKRLRENLGDLAIDFKPYGGYELFLKDSDTNFNECISKIPFINEMLKPLFKADVFSKQVDRFDFNNIHDYLIFNPFEAQIDTGNMMQMLLKKAVSENILILNQQTVKGFSEKTNGVQVALTEYEFFTKKLLFATNGFASQITNNAVKPARAQVLITEPIKNLDIKGTFHLEKGYYYFRNVGDRVLFGGGRNLDFSAETTEEFGETELIQNRLESLLKEVILPNQDFKIAHRWSGIMGLGSSKNPIVTQLSEHVYCGVRLGGMGVAIGSYIGSELADIKKKYMFKRVYRFLLKAMLWFFIISIFLVLVFKFIPVPFTPLMAVRAIENKIDGNEMICSHEWRPIEEISVNLQKAVIASEDARFLTHNGFDFKAIEKAMENNEKGRKLKGGSTISQQTAKNVFLWQGRSYLRKGLEAYFTVLIEIIWGKERIMEVYLNSIEMGDGVYGAQAATKYWYKKDCSSLTKIEAAGIAAILPNPRKFKASNSSAFINGRKARIVKRMGQVGNLEY